MNNKEYKQPISGFVKDLVITEKATVLMEGSSASFGKNKNKKSKHLHSKVIFKVATNATKTSIASELNQRFPENQVVSVNTLLVKPKKKRFYARGKAGYSKMFKKAIVTFKKPLEAV